MLNYVLSIGFVCILYSYLNIITCAEIGIHATSYTLYLSCLIPKWVGLHVYIENFIREGKLIFDQIVLPSNVSIPV